VVGRPHQRVILKPYEAVYHRFTGHAPTGIF
jgi:hypothetical protein